MSASPIPVNVSILGMTYRVACLPEEQAALEKSAKSLEKRLSDAREQGMPMDKATIMTALNLTHELLNAQEKLERISNQALLKLQNLAERAERIAQEK